MLTKKTFLAAFAAVMLAISVGVASRRDAR